VNRRGTRRAARLFGGGLLLCLAAACSAETRYRVLSFLFDGVPAPPGMEAPPEGRAQERRPAFYTSFDARSAAVPRPVQPVSVPEAIVSVHKPFAENKCKECHDPRMGFDTLPLTDARLCDKCHLEQRQKNGWDHGPINLGTCVPCHVPHRSTNPHLLSQPVPDLCLECHSEDLQRREDYHDVPDVYDCLSCHDPHRMY